MARTTGLCWASYSAMTWRPGSATRVRRWTVGPHCREEQDDDRGTGASNEREGGDPPSHQPAWLEQRDRGTPQGADAQAVAAGGAGGGAASGGGRGPRGGRGARGGGRGGPAGRAGCAA